MPYDGKPYVHCWPDCGYPCYQDDAIQPENREAIKKIRDSRVFERMADRLTKAVALPHDLQVVVTDKLPKGIDDPTTEVDGGKPLP